MGNPLLPLPEASAFTIGGKGANQNARDDNSSSAQLSFSDSMKAAESGISRASARSSTTKENSNTDFKQDQQKNYSGSKSVGAVDTEESATAVVTEFDDIHISESDAIESGINALTASPDIAQQLSEKITAALSEGLVDFIRLAEENNGAFESSLSPELLATLSGQLSRFLNHNLTATNGVMLGNTVSLQSIQNILSDMTVSVNGQSLALSGAPRLLQPFINNDTLSSTVNKLVTLNSEPNSIASHALSNLSLIEGATADKLFKLHFSGFDATSSIDNAEAALDGLLKPDRQLSGAALVGTLNQNSAVQGQIPGMKAQFSVTTPFQQAQWGQNVSEQVMWMTKQGIQQAEIHMDPPELGPIHVKVSVVNEQAHVSFVVQNSSVREALDQSAMRLRDMFDGEGLDLVDVDVSDQSQQQSKEGSAEQSLTQSFDNDLEDGAIEGLTQSQLIKGYTFVNTYV